MMNRVGTKSDIGSKGVAHKIQARSGDSRVAYRGVVVVVMID